MIRRESPHIALIGTGDAGTHHVRALNELADITSWDVVVRSEAATEKLRQTQALARQSMPGMLRSIDEVIENADNYDGMIIATPDSLHFAHANLALGSGLHVLIEKPATATAHEAEVLVSMARERNLQLMAGYQMRQHTAHNVIADIVLQSGIAIDSIDLSWHWPDPNRDGWRSDTKSSKSWALAALGTHLIDTAMHITGEEFVLDSAELHPAHEGPETSATLSGRLGSAAVNISTSVDKREASLIKISAGDQTVTLSGTCGVNEQGTVEWYRGESLWLSKEEYPGGSLYTMQLRKFIDQMRNGPRVDRFFVSNVRVLEQIQESRKV